MHSEFYETLIHKHLTGELSEEEARRLTVWLDESPENRRQFEETERVWAMAETAGSELKIDLGGEIDRFKRRVGLDRTHVATANVFRLWKYAAAAVLLLGAVTALLQFRSMNRYAETVVETREGERRQIVLPDESTVWLNENSRLAYAPMFEARSVRLEGEAFFDVRRDASRPFEIQSGLGLIQVLGTSFNVARRGGEIKVTVATGRVALSAVDGEGREEIAAGYQGVLQESDGTLSLRPNETPDVLAWRSRRLVFDETPFDEVVEALRTHFAIVIEEPDAALAACTFSGEFDAPVLQDVVNALQFSLGFQSSVQQGVYAFSGIGCSP